MVRGRWTAPRSRRDQTTTHSFHCLCRESLSQSEPEPPRNRLPLTLLDPRLGSTTYAWRTAFVTSDVRKPASTETMDGGSPPNGRDSFAARVSHTESSRGSPRKTP